MNESIEDLVAAIAWEATRTYNSLSTAQIDTVQDILNKYQMLVLSEPGYTRKDRVERITSLISHTGGGLTFISDRDLFTAQVLRSLVTDLSPFMEDHSKSLEIRSARVATMAVVGEEETDEPEQSQWQMLMKKDEGSKPKGLSAASGDRDQTAMLMEYLEKQSRESRAQMIRLENILLDLGANMKGTDTQLDNTDMVENNKLTKDIAKGLDKLTQIQLKKESVYDVAWADIPEWIKLKYRAGLKITAVGALFFPFKATGKAVNVVIFSPMGYAAVTLYSKIKLLWGTVLWIVCIGSFIVLYRSDTPNVIQQIGPSLYKVAEMGGNVGIGIVEYAGNMVPSGGEFVEAGKDLASDALNNIYLVFYAMLEILVNWFREMVLNGIKEAMPKIPGAGWFS